MPFDAQHEKEILKAVAAGDEQAFRALFEHYHAFLAGHILRIIESRETMEEIVQDVFLKIWLTRETLIEVENFKGYLLVASRNQALTVLTKLMKEIKKRSDYLNNAAQIEEGLPDEFKALQLSLIDEAIDALPVRQKEVYLLHRHERLSYMDIAERMGISRETVKSQLSAAVRSITAHIKAKLAALILLLEIMKN